MKVEITKELENEIDVMMSVAKTAAGIRLANPSIWKMLQEQYLPDGWNSEKHIPDSEENLKIRLYAEIMRKRNELAVKVERKIENK